jgi:hypothetical protein
VDVSFLQRPLPPCISSLLEVARDVTFKNHCLPRYAGAALINLSPIVALLVQTDKLILLLYKR